MNEALKRRCEETASVISRMDAVHPRVELLRQASAIAAELARILAELAELEDA